MGIFGNGATNFSQTGLTGQRGPPLEAVNFHADYSIPFISQKKLLKILAELKAPIVYCLTS